MKLKKQGFFKEMRCGDLSDPSIFDFMKNEIDENEEKICQYLKEGKVLVACSDLSKDIVNCDNGWIGCSDILTDGIWIWPSDLIYYVKTYHVKLDKEFVFLWKSKNGMLNKNS